jgi:UMF1 family MFS transporter
MRADGGEKEQCVVNFLGTEVTTSSFAMYTFSAAVLVQAVTLICFSSFADHGMLILFTV